MGTLLIVDDEPAIRQSLQGYFQDLGFQVRTAASAEEAVAMDGLDTVDAVIMDIRLPGQDGVACMRALAARFPRIRFVVHTGSLDFALGEEEAFLGISEEQVFLKPVPDLEMLRVALERLGVQP